MTKSKFQTVAAVISWLAVALCMAVIFFFSSQSGDNSQTLSDNFAFTLRFYEYAAAIRKIAHYLEFTALGALLSNAFYCTFKKQKPLYSFASGVIYAVSDEIHQLFVNGRACRVFDVFIDSLGVISGIVFFGVIIFLFNRLKLRRNSHD